MPTFISQIDHSLDIFIIICKRVDSNREELLLVGDLFKKKFAQKAAKKKQKNLVLIYSISSLYHIYCIFSVIRYKVYIVEIVGSLYDMSYIRILSAVKFLESILQDLSLSL